ncbi:MAG TPA: sensor histidine kinase [Streptosporangiales bacterium]
MRPGDRALGALASVLLAVYAVAMVVALAALGVRPASFETWGAPGWAATVVSAAAWASFPVVGWSIARRRPRNAIGWLLLAVGLAYALSEGTEAYAHWALVVRPGSLPYGTVALALDTATFAPQIGLVGTFLFLLFPDGRLPARRWLPLAWASGAVIVLSLVAVTLTPGPIRNVEVPGRQNPLGVAFLGAVDPLSLAGACLVVCMLGSAASLALRFRRASGVERLQIKWLAAAAAVVAVLSLLAVGIAIPHQLDPRIPQSLLLMVVQTVELLSFALIPIAIGIAISRHRLYGIDRLISRALVVGALGVFISGVYVAIVVGIGTLIGQRHPSIALSVVATAVVAVAFEPVRTRVRRLANRAVYGERATPYEVLSDFATRMAGTYTTGELLPQLARLVGRCLGGATVEVWTTDGDRPVRQVAWPDGAGRPAGATAPALPVDRRVEIRHQGDLLGLLTVTKPDGEQVTPPEDALLGHVASQAGLVLRNLRLIEDLRSSRERLVSSQDHERRRLERDLHDGAQQSLVSVALLLRMASTYAEDEPDGVGAAVAEAADQLRLAIAELRELARGLHPAILTERGLGPALGSLAERSPVPVRLDCTLPQRLPQTVEATLYYVVAEALTNVARYAAASVADVRVRRAGDEVTAEVVDDGVGGADPVRGSGLAGLADRVAVVGGTLHVSSPAGGGTRLVCRVPLPAPAVAGAAVEEVPA